MSDGFLKTLLGIKKEPLFYDVIDRLEKATGNKGIDTRLIADLVEDAHKLISRLGLDFHDSTAEELYHALLASSQDGRFKSLFSETDYLLIKKDKYVISFNIIDVIFNWRRQLPINKATASAGRRQLSYELARRYINAAGPNKDLVAELVETTKWLPSYDSVIIELKLNKYQLDEESL